MDVSTNSKSGDASSSNHLQGNLPRKGESKTWAVSEPSASADFGPEGQPLIVSKQSGVAKVQLPGPERRVMLPGNQKTFLCPQCNKTFSDKKNRRRHVKTVHEKQNFNCQVCSKTFASRSALVKHAAAEHNNSSFQCPLPSCANYFNTISTLQHHVRKCEEGARIRKCACNILSKYHVNYCFQVFTGGKYICTSKPAKLQPRARRTSKEVITKQRRKPITLRGQLHEKIRKLFLTHPNLHPRIAKFRKRYGYPTHKQESIPWVPVNPGILHAHTHMIMQVIRKKKTPSSSSISLPQRSPLLSTSQGRDMPDLRLDEVTTSPPVEEDPGVNLELPDEVLDFEL